MSPETGSDASIEQLPSHVDLSLSLYWCSQCCMLAQNKLSSASELLAVCFDGVLEPSLHHYHSCQLLLLTMQQ